jgi:hypothetical protein
MWCKPSNSHNRFLSVLAQWPVCSSSVQLLSVFFVFLFLLGFHWSCCSLLGFVELGRMKAELHVTACLVTEIQCVVQSLTLTSTYCWELTKLVWIMSDGQCTIPVALEGSLNTHISIALVQTAPVLGFLLVLPH